MPTLHGEFGAACSTMAEIDSETADLAQQVLERCHNTILETSTFGYGQPAQVTASENTEQNVRVMQHPDLSVLAYDCCF